MPARFIGQFLVEKGLVTQEALVEALAIQSDSRLGALAVAEGWLCDDQLQDLLAGQRVHDSRLGDLAVARGMLSENQRDEIVKRQLSDRRRLGELLVAKGALSASDLETALKAFEHERSQMPHAPLALGKTFGHRLDMITMVGMTPKMLLRIGGLPARMEGPAAYAGAARMAPLTVAISMAGGFSGRYFLGISKELAEEVARNAVAGAWQIQRDDLIAGACALCDGVVSTSIARLCELGHQVALSTPRLLGAEVEEPAVRHGLRWHVHTPAGSAWVVMD